MTFLSHSPPPLKFLLHLFFKKRFILFLGVCIWVCVCEYRCLWRPKGVRTSGAGVGYRQLLMWVLDQNLDLMEEQYKLFYLLSHLRKGTVLKGQEGQLAWVFSAEVGAGNKGLGSPGDKREFTCPPLPLSRCSVFPP